MKNTFWESILSSFLRIENGISLFLATLITLILWNFTSKDKISINIVLVIVFISLVVVGIFFQIAYKAFDENRKLKSEVSQLQQRGQELEDEIRKYVIPKIIRVQPENSTNSIICLLNSSNLFGIEMMVSFHYQDEDDFQHLIGVGYIRNVQIDGKIQAILDNPILAYQKIIDKLASNDHKVLEKTIIRPGIPRNFT